MLKKSLKSVRGLIAGSAHGREKGVAIVTVLALLALMSALAVAFLRMSMSARDGLVDQAEVERASGMKETVISLVTAQLAAANGQLSQTATPDEAISWTTQPGAVRTYSNSQLSHNKLFKLYSSPVPQISDVAPGETGPLLDAVNEDLADDWQDRPDEFTDLNLPLVANGAAHYPIADPGMWDGQADGPENVEGFTYSSVSRSKTIGGIDPRLGRLALPVRWIYQLQDGTLGILTKDRKFQPLEQQATGAVSRENPIVGRMAWWADDESCKINVNTASVPAIWDTPRTTSKEDVWLANSQPLAGEYQRYPGHPSTVDLSAVFFPGRRYTATDGTWTMSPGASMRGSLSNDQAQLIWDMTPFISSGLRNGAAGTLGGSRATPAGGAGIFTDSTHLYASIEEAYFKTHDAYPSQLDTERSSLSTDGQDPRETFLRRLERSQFFLTARSSSMEMTNSGYPRIGMYPVDGSVQPYVNTSSTAALPATVSPYDVTMAVNATLGSRVYYFQRNDPGSRHAELFSYNSGRNSQVFRYLKELSRLPIPGYPNGFAGSKPISYTPTLAQDPTGSSLAAKYPAAYNDQGGRFPDTGLGIANGVTLMDASDCTQILLNMLDYSRSVNMQPAFVAAGNRYDGGNGQATGLCGCGTDAGNHTSAFIFGQKYRTPKGAGKVLVPAEITMVVNVAARLEPGQSVYSNSVANSLRGLMTANTPSAMIADDKDSEGYRYFVEIGFVYSGFSPKHGWSPLQPNASLWVTTPYGGISSPISSLAFNNSTSANVGNVFPLIADLGAGWSEYVHMPTTKEVASGGSTGYSSAPGVPPNIIPYGGMQGPRALMPNAVTKNTVVNPFAICSPLCYRSMETGLLKVDLRVDPSAIMRMMSCDGGAYESNVQAAFDLRLPSNFVQNITLPVSGTSLRTRAIDYNQGTIKFPDTASCAIRSLVLPSGDYRMVTGFRVDSDMFVAHANAAANGNSLYEANVNPALRMLSHPANYSQQTLVNKDVEPKVTNYVTPQSGQPMSSLPLPLASSMDMANKSATLLVGANTTNGLAKLIGKTVDQDLVDFASMDPDRRQMFGFGRRDGHNFQPKRGSSDPDETGDFDNGVAAAEDGPYMNYPDEGDRRGDTGIRYFNSLTSALKTSDPPAAQCISPNLLLRSPVDFGSIPSGIQARVPWQTLRFRPDPGMNDPQVTVTSMSMNPPAGLPFANFCGPRDHFFLDMFWMPVIEPWGISTPGVTQGTINLNQQILPFLYVNRTTALHALLRGERMLAIPNEAADKYKKTTADGTPDNPDSSYRYFLNTRETVKQFLTRYTEGRDPEGFSLAFNTFRSASELCEVWLVPDKNGDPYDGDHVWDLAWTIGRTNADGRDGFWARHRPTGDNSRERPYSNLYPRVTVRSNVFKLHLITQALQTPRTGSTAAVTTKPGAASPRTASGVTPNFTVSGEWRGSCLIERTFDPLDVRFKAIDYTNLAATALNPVATPRLETFHSFTVSNVKAFEP